MLMYHVSVAVGSFQFAGCGMCVIVAAIVSVLHASRNTEVITIPREVLSAANVLTEH